MFQPNNVSEGPLHNIVVIDLTRQLAGPLNKYNVEPISQIKKYMELNGKEKKVGDNPEVLYFQATKRIKKGEELYFNYGKAYWWSKTPRNRDKIRRLYIRKFVATCYFVKSIIE